MDAIMRLVDYVVITVHRINQAGCHGCFASTECAVALLGTRPDYFTVTLNQPVALSREKTRVALLSVM